MKARDQADSFLRANEQRRAEMLAHAGGRAVEFDCETAGDFDFCDGCALHGPTACTRQHLTDLDHATCEAEARRLASARGNKPCHDCAFRKGSPERLAEMTDQLVKQAAPFRCHQAAPLDGKGRTPTILAFWPREEGLYPVCAGWAAARAALKLRRSLARALAQLNWRLSARRGGSLAVVRARLRRGARAWGVTQRQRVAVLGARRFREVRDANS